MSSPIPQRSWNSTPTGPATGRLAKAGKEAHGGSRCTVEIDGEPCGRFPSWPAGKGVRHCEYHRALNAGVPLTDAQEGSLSRGA